MSLQKFFSSKSEQSKNETEQKTDSNSKSQDYAEEMVKTLMWASDMGTCGYLPMPFFAGNNEAKKEESDIKNKEMQKTTEEEVADLTRDTLNPFI